MSFHTLYITKRCFVKVLHNQLVIEGSKCVHIPLEDIQTLVLESQQITITTAALSRLSEQGCDIIFCGADHKPVGVQLPFMPHSRQALINRGQFNWTEPFKKRCHQRIIKQKILNQAMCQELLEEIEKSQLRELVKRVQLGDKTHCEALAASLYFSWYLDGHGRREEEFFLNDALNYAYAVVRSRISQSLSACGFIPGVGLFHCSELNNFNLADDIIEPFRPIVDYYIYTKMKDHTELLTPEKSLILKLLETDIKGEGQNQMSLSRSIEQSVHSLQKASEKLDSQYLIFPDLGPLKEHIYE